MSRSYFHDAVPATSPRLPSREPVSKAAERSIDRVGTALDKVFAAAKAPPANR
jgi:hypothetical protein